MLDTSIPFGNVNDNAVLPDELTEHVTPPKQGVDLAAWLRLQALRHATYAEQRPWARGYHERMAQDASAAAEYHERRREVRK